MADISSEALKNEVTGLLYYIHCDLLILRGLFSDYLMEMSAK